MLSVGLIGLPNVGKSTLFNALTSGSAAISNYPFTTIDSNVGVVPVPDFRLTALKEILDPEDVTPAFIEFIDIAGLVEGASKGEGLGNQFLGNIRSVDAIAHVVRCFQEGEVAHVLGDVNPIRDIEIVETELLLADLEVLDKAIDKRIRLWKTDPRKHAREKERLQLYRDKLAAGIPLRTLEIDADEINRLKGLGMLTSKPVLYVANISESDFDVIPHPCAVQIQEKISGADRIVTLSVQLEFELQQLAPEERKEFEREMGIEGSGLLHMVAEAYGILDLITFYTVANNRLRAWEIPRLTRAVQAAGKIHTDMEKGFIRAQVVDFDDLATHGDLQALHKKGLLRTEGKDYIVQDGDVIEFLFSPAGS